MAAGFRLEQKQSQSLVMTPQLAQSIKLLQLGSQELMEFVHSEIEKNPLLELEPDPEGPHADRRNSRSGPAEESGKEEPGDLVTHELGTDAGAREADIDASFENVYDAERTGAETAKPKDANDNLAPSGPAAREQHDLLEFASTVSEQPTLAQYLEAQIGLVFRQTENRQIAAYIAHGLDEDGYFREPVSEAAKSIGTNSENFLEVLTRFQALEPTGIGARSLSECLQLQLAERDRLDPAMSILVNNLGLLAKREYSKLMKLCGVTRNELSEMVQELRRLDPRPAAKYEAVIAEAVVADVIVTQKPDGDWAIELNPETLPKVLVDQEYYTELNRTIETAEGREFIGDCMTNANWLIKSLDQRARTILKVATEIIRQQDMFFASGIEHLKPMNLKAVAEAIQMHESTVSRVTANKYLRCEQGIFELKFFFSSSVSAASENGELSSESVKHRIKQLVDGEKPSKVLSDDQIVEQLQEAGIEIARRTVAKYREAMRIPSSVQRRRDKRQALI